MSFLFPAAFFFAALIPVIVALYLRRPRRRTQEVSSLLFWQRVLEREPRRRFLGRLRNILSLLLQILLFLLLLLALARPELFRPPNQRHTVVVLDQRARMQAGSTFGDALAAARQLVAGAGPDEEIALLGVAGTPQVISPFSTDAADLRQRLQDQHPSDGGGPLGETLDLARRLLDAKPGDKRLVLISDRPAPEAKEAEVILTGQSRDNAAILELAPRPIPASPQSVEILARIGNFSPAAREVEFELSLDDRPIDLQRLQIAPGGERDFTSVLPAETFRDSQGLLTARLTAQDALPVDDTARAVLPVARPLRALLVTNKNPFLENALRADPAIALDILSPDLWRPGLGGNFDAVLWDEELPDGATLESLGPGNYLFFGKSPFDRAEAPPPIVDLESASGSPLLWNVDFRRVRLAPQHRLVPPREDGWRSETILSNVDEPLLFTAENAQGQRVVASAFGATSSDFPLKTGFPLFVNNAVRWLGKQSDPFRPSLRAGDTYVPKPGETLSLAPQKPEEPATNPTSSGPVRLDRVGFYSSLTGEQTGWLAVNTADAQESDLRAATKTTSPLLTLAHFAGLQPWQWIALLALLLLVVEWTLHHRRITE